MVMSRLIDADKLLNKIDAYMCGSQDVMFVKELIKEQPTAFDVDKVVEKIDKDINWYQFLKDNLKCNGTVITSDRGVIATKQAILQNVKDIVRKGGDL
jgi:transcription initiation factor IIF auxiliary subunit